MSSSFVDAILIFGLLSNSSNTTGSPASLHPPSSPTANDDLANGICTSTNMYFVLKMAGCMVLFVVSGFMSYMVSYRPSTTTTTTTTTTTPGGDSPHPSTWKPYYGRPYSLGLLGMGLSVWSLLPSLVMFVVFHVALPDVFPMATQMACTQITTFPFLPVVVVAQMVILFLVYDASSLGNGLNPLINNNSGMAPPTSKSKDAHSGEVHAPHNKVLMLGAPSCGLLFARAMKDECDDVLAGVETTIFDFSHDRDFLIHNAVAVSEGRCTVEDVAARIISSQGVTVEERLTMSCTDCSFDKIVVCPTLRSSDPIGTRLSSEQTKSKRMAILLSEAVRVLRPGGSIICVDTMEGTLLASADMRDITGDSGSITDPSVTVGSLPILKTRYMQLHWTKPLLQDQPITIDQCTVVVPEGNTNDTMPNINKNNSNKKRKSFLDYLVNKDSNSLSTKSKSTNNEAGDDGLYNDAFTTSTAGLLPPTTTTTTPKALSPSARAYIVVPYQLVVFTAILFSVAALFSRLNVPTDVVLSLRVNSYVASMSMTYPIVTFFIRYAIDDMEHITTTAMLLKMVVLTDCVAILMTICISTCLWLPQFLVQVSLSPTGLSANVKTYIGIGVSIVFGACVFKASHWRRDRALIMGRQFNDEQIKMFKS